MEIWQSAALAVTSALLCLVLRQYRPEFALVMAILCGVFLLSSVITQLSPVFSGLYELVEQTNVAPTYLQIVIKSFGICYLAQLAADLCRDAGQTAIASKIELAGRAAVRVMAMPLFFEIVKLAVSMIASK